MNTPRQKLLITGGSGYLGGELVRQALAVQQFAVTATYTSQHSEIAGAHFVPLDLRDNAAAQALITHERPDIVIHTAYVQRDPDLWQISAIGAGQVAHAAAAVGARLIHLSSDALFDGKRVGLYNEADGPSPITAYGEAKAAAERLVAASHQAALIVRTSLIYGGAQPSPHELLVLRALNGASDVSFFTDEIRNPIAVADLATALLELVPTAHSGILHVAGADAVSRYEFACRIAQAAGHKPAPLRAALSANSGMRRPRNVALDSSRAQSLLHTRLRGVRELLSKS